MDPAPRWTGYKAGRAEPTGPDLPSLLTGRRIEDAWYGTVWGARCAALHLRLDDGQLLTIIAHAAPPATVAVGGPKLILGYHVAKESRLALRPTRPLSLGDGSETDRQLKAFVVGQKMLGVERGAMSEEGYAVNRLVFEGESQALLLAQPMSEEIAAQTGVLTAVRLVFLGTQPMGIVTPGQCVGA